MKTTSANLISRFHKLMNNDPCIECESVKIGNVTYFVTRGTGEGNFAYTRDEFESGIEAGEAVENEVYQEFCENAQPVSSNPKLAQKIFDKINVKICNPGSCAPMF